LDELRPLIHGMVHCSGGALTKVMHFVENMHVVKNNLFEIPPLFRIIQEQSGTEWKEMYKVFNMGQRLEVYLPEQGAQQVIDIARSFGIEAQICGYCERAEKNQLDIISPYGTFTY
jgi:phosphoribosylformylglycinamidine cyclo-ligase